MSSLSPTQQEGLKQVLGLMQLHGLTQADVKAALAQEKRTGREKSGNFSKGEMILRLFTYLGGALIFAGLGVFIETIWGDIGSLSRVVITLGAGFTAYLLGVLFAHDARLEKAATPTFLVAALLQPMGLFVFLDEYFDGGDAALGGIFVFGLLLVQQALTFVKLRRPALLLFSLLAAISFTVSVTEYFDINRGLSALMCGTFLFFVTVDLHKRETYKDLTPFLFIVSTLFFFPGLYHFIGNTIYDSIGLAFTLAMLAFAVLRSHKTLYVLSILYTCAYFIGGPGGGWYGGWNIYKELNAVFAGSSLLLAGHWLRRFNFISLYPVWMFAGIGFALGGVYSILYETPLEAAFIGAAALGIYASLLLRSRAALAASVLWLIGFISAFSARHFADTVGWPLLLIVLGFLILGAGLMFARLAGRIRKSPA